MQSTSPETGRQEGKRILLVEDEILVRMALAGELRAAGFSVVEAATGEEALDYLRSGARVDLVLSDIQMPGAVNGLALARRCRRYFPALPVILTSGGARPQSLEGARRFIPKPCSEKVAIAAINEALSLKANDKVGRRNLAP